MPVADRKPGERWTCSCGELLIGALTINGRTAPITWGVRLDGNVWLGRSRTKWFTPDGQLVEQDDPRPPVEGATRVIVCAVLAGPILEKARAQDMGLHLNHYADCPHKARYERRTG